MFTFYYNLKALSRAKRIYKNIANSGDQVNFTTVNQFSNIVELEHAGRKYYVKNWELSNFVQRHGGKMNVTGVNSYLRILALAMANNIYQGANFSRLYSYRNRL